MPNHRYLRFLLIVSAGLMLTLELTGCARTDSRSQTLTGYADVNIRNVALMPFFQGQPDMTGSGGIASPLDCTVEAFCLVVNDLMPNAQAALTRQTQAAMAERFNERLIPLDRVLRVYGGMPINDQKDTPRALARRLGELLDTDHVMIGSVWQYREKTETEGASVGFALYLVEVDSGRRVWRGRFDKTQVGLTEDISDIRDFFQRGFRWLSAEELARHGIERVLGTFPRVE